ncbi:hypothetical protein [Butyrivibrio sp. INlla16]|uniref:hypothetical protein n=1 Tax=Butyrivibrio sp. INlla16 TaxID=1520807 RepID=UPI00088576B1|nr:hypothetical protein [Butyrivibrio sp. INlla16]SDB29473.1 hypothetical protein SAMN02910263_01442 [Butyrivibrio sp. INlla16]
MSTHLTTLGVITAVEEGIAKINPGELHLRGKITSTATGNESCGIYADQDILIESGAITAEGGVAGISNYNTTGGVHGNISITGGTVNAKGTSVNLSGMGIYGYNQVNIQGGTVTAEGKGSAIIATNGNLSIGNGITKVSTKTSNGQCAVMTIGNGQTNFIDLGDGVVITKPVGGVVYAGNRILDEPNNVFAKEVVFEPASSGDDNNNDDNNNNNGNNNNGNNNNNNNNTNENGNENGNGGGNSDPQPPAENPTPKMELNASILYIKTGERCSRVTAKLTNDSIQSVTSYKPKIATASFSGNKITIKAGKKAGTAKMQVVSSAGNRCMLIVHVQNNKVTTKTIKLSKGSSTLKKGGSPLAIKVTVTPDKISTGEKVKVKLSKKGIVTVKYDEETGILTITPKKKGTCNILLTAGKKTKTIKVKVK